MSQLFEVTYGQQKTSVNTNELGMREMQARVYDRRASQYLLVKAPPASGKSRALMFVALDKLKRQGLKKAIIVVPEKSIGKSFRSTKLSDFGYYWDWTVKEENNLTTSGTAKSKVDSFIRFIQSEDEADDVLIATHATLRFASEKLDASDFDDCLLAIDEFHHVSQDDNSVLGNTLREVLQKSTTHVFAMTGSYFRGDSVPILDPADEARFDRVTYTYYEQLEGYLYLKSFVMNYKFYRGRYTDAFPDLLPEFIDKKTIIHIPNVNSGESSKDKYGEVDEILDCLGDYLHKDEHGIIHLRSKTGKILKIADLVTEDGRDRVSTYLEKMDSEQELDMIIALGMAKEGFDWPFAEYALTIGYRSSLTEIVQIIGRVTRDSPNKTKAQFTNLIAEPDAEDEEVQFSVNNVMKAITASLLMENVLSPSFKFKRKEHDGQKANGAEIFIKGLAKPSTERTQKIIEQDIADLKASVLQDDVMQAAISAGADSKVINKQLIPRVIATRYPDLTQTEVEEVRQHLVADLTLSTAKKDKENKQLLKMADKFINIDELHIDLIDSVNPFQSAYEVLSRDVDSRTLSLIARVFDAKKVEFTTDELWEFYHKIKNFQEKCGRSPRRNSSDVEEKELYFALVKFEELRREKNNQTKAIFETLEEIFADSAFDSLVAGIRTVKVEAVNPEIEKFLEIVNWVRENGREPQKTKQLKERQLFSRLKAFRSDETRRNLALPYDEFGLLGDGDDILNDDSLFKDFQTDDRLFQMERYQRTVRMASKNSRRKAIQSFFAPYKQQFERVHAEIASGERTIRRISDAEISQKSPIKQGNYYIDNGVMLYVNRIYDPETGENFSESSNRRLKVHLIYENGTENTIWMLSLVSSLYDRTRSGRLVTERLADNDLLGEKMSVNVTTGYIYVVQYRGEDSRFIEIDNLYKIGFAQDVHQRLRNTSNESTYLYAPVQLVAQFAIQNLSAQKVERYLHTVFASKRVNLEVTSPNGKPIAIKEWFIVSLDEIENTINRMVMELQLDSTT